jgi:hypothetical protein
MNGEAGKEKVFGAPGKFHGSSWGIDEKKTEHKRRAKAKKPHGNLENVTVAQGLKKQPSGEAEVTGHSTHPMVLCCRCHRPNYTPPEFPYFYCWYCGAICGRLLT